ncbi:MAG: restriction endonuclease subunit S [Pirellula sp.]
MSEDSGLPKGWSQSELSSVSSHITDGSHLPPPKQERGLPMLSATNVNNNSISLQGRLISEAAFDAEHKRTQIQAGDVLLTIVGTIGRSAVVPEKMPVFTLQRSVAVIRSSVLVPKFLAYLFQSTAFQKKLQAHARGTAQKGVYLKSLRGLVVLLAPFNEQHRIVAKIEELFSALDAGVAALKRAKANLKRYRASVLKAAVEGKLTEEWRAKHPVEEPASTLLARILKERRQNWEADQLAKFTAAKKEPPKNWRDKYVEPTRPDTTGLPELPDGWCWASVEQLLVNSPQNGAYFPKTLYGSGIPIIRIDDYQQFWSRSANEVQRVQVPARDIELYGLSGSDILVNRVNSMTHLGKVLLIEARHLPSIFESNMMRLRCVEKQVVPYVRDYLRSHSGIARLRADAKWAVNQASINQQDVQRTSVPFPPLAEQQGIVNVVDEKLSQIDAAEMQIEHGLLRASRLRQSILKQAFEGKLVPQDPKDEPTSVLLARLRASRAHDEANGTAETSKRNRAKIKESSGEPRTRIRRGPSSQNQQEE